MGNGLLAEDGGDMGRDLWTWVMEPMGICIVACQSLEILICYFVESIVGKYT